MFTFLVTFFVYNFLFTYFQSLESLFDDLENEEGGGLSNKHHQSFSSLGQTFDQKFLDDNVSILAASDDNQTIRVS